MNKDISIDVRKVMKEANFTVRVQMKNMWLLRLGILFIRFGCFLSGAQYVNEFPMSLIQNGKEVEMDK